MATVHDQVADTAEPVKNGNSRHIEPTGDPLLAMLNTPQMRAPRSDGHAARPSASAGSHDGPPNGGAGSDSTPPPPWKEVSCAFGHDQLPDGAELLSTGRHRHSLMECGLWVPPPS